MLWLLFIVFILMIIDYFWRSTYPHHCFWCLNCLGYCLCSHYHCFNFSDHWLFLALNLSSSLLLLLSHYHGYCLCYDYLISMIIDYFWCSTYPHHCFVRCQIISGIAYAMIIIYCFYFNDHWLYLALNLSSSLLLVFKLSWVLFMLSLSLF